MQTVRAADTNEVVKLIFRESDNDRKVSEARTVGRAPRPSGVGGRLDSARGLAPTLPTLTSTFALQVMLQLEKKLFHYFNQEVFRDNNGTAVSSAADGLEAVAAPGSPGTGSGPHCGPQGLVGGWHGRWNAHAPGTRGGQRGLGSCTRLTRPPCACLCAHVCACV